MKTELTSFREAIRVKYDALTAAFDLGRADAVARDFFAPDGLSIGEGAVTAVGHDAIEALFGPFVGAFTYKVTSRSSHVNGSLGWDFADIVIDPAKPEAGDTSHAFKSVFLWEQIGKEWVCKAQMYSSGTFPDKL